MDYVLGIDQGGTKTQVIVADSLGRILGLGQSKGACHSSDGMEKAMTVIREAASSAMSAAGVDVTRITEIAGGLTGVDWEDEADLLCRNLAELFGKSPEHIHVVNDCIIAMRAETKEESACILCAGTGLNCAVKKDKNTEYVFGFYIADEFQGGSALGARTLQAVVDAESGLQDKTALTELLLAHFSCLTVDELLRRKVTDMLDGEKVRSLPLVLEQAALANDKVSLAVLAEFGRDIARYVVAAMRRFDLLGEEIDIVLSGSIFKCRVPVLQDMVAAEIHRHAARARIIDSRYEPVVGAVLLALDQLYDDIPEEVYRNIKAAEGEYRIVRKGSVK